MYKKFAKLNFAAALTLLLASPLAMAQSPQGGQQGAQSSPAQQQQQQQHQGQQQHQQRQQAQQGRQAPPQAQAEDFSDQQLNQFADSYMDIMSIQEEYTAKLEQADDREQAQNLQQEANQEMVQAIEDNGLSVQDYTSIATAMDQDQELREDVIALVEARR